jgi:hypothetical protein
MNRPHDSGHASDDVATAFHPRPVPNVYLAMLHLLAAACDTLKLVDRESRCSDTTRVQAERVATRIEQFLTGETELA